MTDKVSLQGPDFPVHTDWLSVGTLWFPSSESEILMPVTFADGKTGAQEWEHGS